MNKLFKHLRLEMLLFDFKYNQFLHYRLIHPKKIILKKNNDSTSVILILKKKKMG